MKNRIYIIIAFLLISMQSFSIDKLIFQQNPQTRKEDFTTTLFPNLSGWYIQDLKVPADYTLGFKIVVELSAPETPISGSTIFRLGGIYKVGNTENFHSGYALRLKDDTFVTERMISLEGKNAKSISYSAWNKKMLEKGHNYSLVFDIDETRLRVTAYKDENRDTPVIEYEFNGLAHSQLRKILSGEDGPGLFSTIAICTDKRIPIRLVSVYTLTNSVVVDNPQTSQPFIANLANSSLYIRPVNGDFDKGTPQEINTLKDPFWSMWEITPLYDKNRLRTEYKAKIRNLQSNKYMIVKDASTADLTPITQGADDLGNKDNTTWNVEFESQFKFTLKNKKTQCYAVVKDASTSPGARVVQYSTAITPNSKWSFTSSSFNDSSPIETGYYKIKNKNSNLYLALGSDFHYARQQPQYTYGSDDIWYVEKQPGGVYSIRNVYLNKYMVALSQKFATDPYIYFNDIDAGEGMSGRYLWGFIPYENLGMEIRQAYCNQSLGILDASKTANAQCYLYSKSSSTPPSHEFWEFIPVDYTLDVNMEGFYKIKYASSNKYLVVKEASISAGTPIVASSSADAHNGWWYLKKADAGGYLIYNVGNNLLMTNQVSTPTSNGTVKQYYPETGSGQKSQEWRIYHSNEQNKYLISNFNGGKGLAFNEPTPDNTQAITRFQYTASAKWIFEPVILSSKSTRSSILEPEDGIYETIPIFDSSKNDFEEKEGIVKNDNISIRGAIEAFCVDNTLLAKSDNIIKSIDIYDISGKRVGHSIVANYFASIDVAQLSKGAYIAVIQTEEAGLQSVKFIK